MPSADGAAMRGTDQTFARLGRVSAALTVLLLGKVVRVLAPALAILAAIAGTGAAAIVGHHLFGHVRPFVGAFGLFAICGALTMGLAVYLLRPLQLRTAQIADELIDRG